MTKTTKTIELKKGFILNIIVELFELDTEGDAWEGISAHHEKWFKINFEFCAGGKVYTGSGDLYITDSNYLHKIVKLPAEVVSTLNVRDGNNNVIKLQFQADNAAKIAAAIVEAKEELMTPEVKEFFAKQEAKKQEVEQKNAQYVVNECEKVIVARGKLMTAEEKKEYLANYNNVMNEGGEGYTPKVWTQEEYERAKEILRGN